VDLSPRLFTSNARSMTDSSLCANMQYQSTTDDGADGVLKKSVCAQQGIDFEKGELETAFDDLVNRYELHLNMLRCTSPARVCCEPHPNALHYVIE
jgi:hypothetical protein